MSTGSWIVVAAVAVALAFGTYRLLTDGRFRGTRPVVGPMSDDGAHPVVDESAHPVVDESASARVSKAPVTTWTHVTAAVPTAALGERATLVQFSSAFCAPCRATRRVLSGVAELVPGVTHLEIDAEHHLELVREVGILRTPTTLVLDHAGQEVARATGAPRTEQVLAAVERA